MINRDEVTVERVKAAITTLAHLHAKFPDDKDFLILDKLEATLVELEREALSSPEHRFTRYLSKPSDQTAAL